jgi:broad specificity phosphatase PhoE
MNVNLFFVRHGQTTANRDEVLQGHCDYPLTDLGKSQLSATGAKLREVQFAFCFVSDLSRALDSAMLLMDNLATRPTNVVETRDLREQAFGVREAKPKHLSSRSIREGMAREQLGDADRWAEIPDPAESSGDLKARQEAALTFIAGHLSPLLGTDPGPVNVLVVSHGGFIRQFLRNYCGAAVSGSGSIINGAVSVVRCRCEHSLGASATAKLVGLSALPEMTNMDQEAQVQSALQSLQQLGRKDGSLPSCTAVHPA